MPRVLHYSDLENAYDDTERIARLAGLLGELRGENALLVGSGDDLALGVCSLSTRGGCALPFFEAVSPDVETFGSHDFDYGLDRTQEIVADSAQQWISANVSHEKGSFGANEGVISYTICESDGDRVGFVGVTDPATTDMAPGASALSISDPVAAVEEGVRELRPRVEYLCVLSHCGALDTDIARRCAVDRVLDGHVHDERITTIAGTVCTRPNANGHRICEIDLNAGEAAFRETAAGPIDEELRGVYENLPSIAPFSGGLARHHTRLFSRPDIDLTVLMGELFVPLGAADPFGSAIVEWTERNAVEEIAVLSGVPLEHGPEAHWSFYIATDDYREKHHAGPRAQPRHRRRAPIARDGRGRLRPRHRYRPDRGVRSQRQRTLRAPRRTRPGHPRGRPLRRPNVHVSPEPGTPNSNSESGRRFSWP